MRALPNIEVFAPSDSVQTEALTKYLSTYHGPAYMRTGRGDVEAVYDEGEQFEPHRAKLVCEGSDMTIIACGETVWHARQAAIHLKESGVSARVLDMFCLKPADERAVIAAARETGAILTVEEHSIYGGLGELVAGVTARHAPVKMRMLGFPDEEYKVGKSDELFEYYGLNAGGIVKAAIQLLRDARVEPGTVST